VGDNGCLGNPFTVTVTVNPEPVVANQLKTICSDAPLGISFNSSTSIAAATYNITAITQNGLVASAGNPAIGNGLAANVIADDAFTNTTSAAVNVVYTVVPVSADGCQGNPFTLTVTVNPEPVVANQTLTICSDAPVGISFGNDPNLPNVVSYNITGLALNSLTVSAGGAAIGNGLSAAALANDAFTNTTSNPVDVVYTVVPITAVGCQGNPFTVTVTVNPEPVVTNQIVNVCSEVPFTGFILGDDTNGPAVISYNITDINLNGLTVSAGNPMVDTGLSPFALADDAFTNTTSTPVNVIYTVVPVSAVGCLGNPFTVTATINPEPVVANQLKPICSNAPLGISFNPSTSIAAATYNITAINQNGLVATAGNPATGNGLAANVIADDAFTNTTNAAVNVVYDVIPVSADGCQGNPFTLTVTVNPEPIVANQNLTVVGNGSVGLILGNDLNGPNVSTYNITSIQSNGLIPGSGNIGIQNGVSQNAIASDTWSNPSNATNTVIYTIVPVTSAGCQGNPFTVTLTITAQPVVVNQNQTVCSDSPLTGFTLGNDTDGAPTVVSYNITAINLNGLTISAGSPAIGNNFLANVLADDAFTNTTSAPVNVVYTIIPKGDNGSFGDPFTVTATINPEPVVANQLKPICSDEPLGISLNPSTSIAAAAYNITAINQNGLVASAGNPATGNGLAANIIADDAFTNNTNAAVNVVYTVVPVSADGCQGNPFTLTVTVNPEPIVADQTVSTVCSDVPLGVNFNSSTSVAATTYNVTALNLNGLTVSAGGAAVANGLTAAALADDAFTNTTNAAKNVVYTVVPVTAAGCIGNPFTVTVTVNPEPVVVNQIITVCSDSPLTGFTLGNDTDGAPTVVSYNITDINLNGLSVSAGSPAIGNNLLANVLADDAFTNTTNAAKDVVYTIVPVGINGCLGNPFTVTATINPEPLGISSTPTVCSDQNFSFNPQDNVNSGNSIPSTFVWEVTAVTGTISGVALNDQGTGNVTDAITNSTATNAVVEYTITPTSANGCIGTPFKITLTVSPEPVVANQNLTICSDNPLGVNFNSSTSVAAATYNVTAINLNGLTVSAGGAAVANGLTAAALADDAFTNPTNAPVNVIYTVVPVTAAGCLGNPFTVTVTVKPPIVINGEPHSYNGFGISCFVANDGFINLNPTGGKLPGDPAGYTYSWTGPNGFTSTDQNIDELVPGTYTVTVGEASGICTQTKTFVVTEPQPVVITETLSNYNGFEISCFGASDGNINLSVTGGTSTYTYLWTASLGGLVPAGMETAANLTGVRAGTYSVKVLDSNGCEKIETYELRQPAPVAISEVVLNRRNILCYGEATGNITVIGSGGIKQYTFTVTGTDYTGAVVSLTSGPTNLNLFSFSTLKAGTYVLTLTDLNGCQKSVNPITLTQPLAPLQITNEVLSNYNGFNIACFGDTNGSITHQVSGGTPFGGTAPYRYAWTGPNGFSSTSLNLSNLAAGTYRLTITDAVNCTLVKTYEMRQPDPIDVDAVKQNVLCGGELSGNIFIRNVTGGTGTYQFLWLKDGVGEIKRSIVPEDLRNIGPGRYILLITDQNFCEYIEVFDVTEPVPLVTTLVKKENNLCFGESKGSIQINVAGGTAPYRYAWTGPGGYTSTNKDLTGLLSGTYQVAVTDALLCTSTLSVTITQPTEIIVTPTLTMVSCPDGKDGAISMTVSGGIPPYVYAWTGPSGFKSTTKDLSNLSAGNYDLVITDGIGCKITRTFKITAPDPIVITPTISNYNGFQISCKGGSDGVIDLKITGGNGNYKYFWEGPGGFRSNLPKIEKLFPGKYEVTVIDSKNCIAKASYDLVAPEELLITKDDVQITDVSCFDGRDGTLTVTIKKASVGPYRYELSGTSVTGFPVSESILSNNLSYQFTGLRAGSYTLRVSDANGCALSELSGLVVSQPSAALGFTIQKTDNLCYRANNGTIRITPTGGTAPYTIRWSNLSQAFSLQNLAPGTYTATLTDAKGCTIAISTEIKEAPIYDLTETVKNISCFGKKDGSIQLNIIGGKAPIKIQWAHGPQEPTLNNLDKGVYSVVITDAGGCKIERQFVINEPQPLDLSATVSDALDCVDPNSGSINITPFGGTPPYTYNWSNGSKTQNLSAIGPGSYSLELVDVNGCRILKQFTVIRPLPLEVSVVQTTERVCNPRGLKSNFKVTVKGGIAPYTVTWNRGTATNAGLVMDTQELGVFIVTVKDARGCIQTKRMEVIETDPLIADFDYTSASFDFSFENLVNFEVQFKNLSIGKYKEASWDFGDGGSSLDKDPKKKYAKAGTYIVQLKLKDLDGCVISFSKEIVITDYYLEFPNVFTPNDDSVNDHFYPKFIFIKDIHVTIINKWGELVYESKALDALGWDGLHNGERATIGNYVCRVRHTTLDGRKIDQSAVFYLGR
jgi:gliding motility-associated-like protein